MQNLKSFSKLWNNESTLKIIFLFKILFIYSWEAHGERKREKQRHRQREKQAPCREPNVRLDPGSPGSRPGWKAVQNHWATRAAQINFTKEVKDLYSENHKDW